MNTVEKIPPSEPYLTKPCPGRTFLFGEQQLAYCGSPGATRRQPYSPQQLKSCRQRNRRSHFDDLPGLKENLRQRRGLPGQADRSAGIAGPGKNARRSCPATTHVGPQNRTVGTRSRKSQAHTSQAAQKALTDSVCLWYLVQSAQHLSQLYTIGFLEYNSRGVFIAPPFLAG